MRNYLKHIGKRGSGRTFAVVEACKLIGATLVCANRQQANQVKQQYKIPTVTIDHNGMGDRTNSYLYDHFAVDILSERYESVISDHQSLIAEKDKEIDSKTLKAIERENKIVLLEEENERLREALNRVQTKLVRKDLPASECFLHELKTIVDEALEHKDVG